jgi:hypothetical protein
VSDNSQNVPLEPRSQGDSPIPHRAARLRVEAPVAYRAVSDGRWATGSTIDISTSGILFVPADGAVPENTDLQVVVYLSKSTVEVNGAPLPMPDLYCGGRIARVTEAVGGRRALALRIDYEWAHQPPARLWDTGLNA